jgi:prepilin signal peptidase PulO-like enzyme (type II secretory pathway)
MMNWSIADENGDISIMIISIIVIYSLFIGSFLNVVALRWISKESWVRGRSHCTHCEYTLRWYDLIPVLSYVMLRGKCRKCKAKISPLYALGELTYCLINVGIYLQFGLSKTSLLLVILFIPLFISSITDIKIKEVDLRVHYWFLPIIVVMSYFLLGNFNMFILTGLVVFLVTYLIHFTGKLGGGDVIPLTMIALVVGPLDFMNIVFLAAVLGLVIAVAGMIIKRKKVNEGLAALPAITVSVFIVVVCQVPILL